MKSQRLLDLKAFVAHLVEEKKSGFPMSILGGVDEPKKAMSRRNRNGINELVGDAAFLVGLNYVKQLCIERVKAEAKRGGGEETE